MGLLEKIQHINSPEQDSNAVRTAPVLDTYAPLEQKLHDLIIDKLGSESAGGAASEVVKSTIDELIETEGASIPRTERTRISTALYNDIMGCGPIEDLLNDPSVTEIMVNGPSQVYIEKNGKLQLSGVTFRDETQLMNVIDRIVSAIGRHIDEASPMVDARLADGSRVNVIIPPLSLVGPVITIRKFSKKPITAQNLIDFGSLTPKMMAFLDACVKGHLNIIVSGGTGSGKTTLLNVLSSFIQADERIVTVEDAAELQLHQSHIITLESRPPNLEGKGQITIRDLVRNCLRMRPDRIIVGEVRSGEALDMLQAMNTGHDGSMTTTHANSPRDTIARIETMVMMAGIELPLKAVRDQIASAVDVIVQQSRLRDGTRKITNITEVTGMEGDVVSMQDIFVYETDGQLDSLGRFRGHFKSTGVRPICVEKIRSSGIPIYDDWFHDN
ncbi:MAG: CpaF family protein [Bacillota bacterium]|nr:CpaF family protein [Bacillota bacterium]